MKYRILVKKMILIVYYSKSKSDLKIFFGFKGPLGFYKKYKRWLYNTRKSRRKLKKIKSDINEITKEGGKSEEQNSAIKNIKTLYES